APGPAPVPALVVGLLPASLPLPPPLSIYVKLIPVGFPPPPGNRRHSPPPGRWTLRDPTSYCPRVLLLCNLTFRRNTGAP
ncbi:hypothetical protein BO70DRAFT_335590, partial [Aspergillus heteromorphus CBS 117.55]